MNLMKNTSKKFCFYLLLFAVILTTIFFAQTVYSIPNEIVIIDEQNYELQLNALLRVNVEDLHGDNNLYLKNNKLIYYKNQEVSATQQSYGNATNHSDAVVRLFNLIPIKNINVSFVRNVTLVPCGNVVGIKIYSDGVLVVGTNKIDGVDGQKYEPYRIADIKLGDYITEVNGVKINFVQDLTDMVKNSNGNSLSMRIMRDEKEILTNVVPVKAISTGEYKIGVWVRDGSAGIGTMTFYNPVTKKFGALGHGITDVDTGDVINIDRGVILDSEVTSVKKGEKGSPGELVGDFSESKVNGKVDKNISTGIYGTLDDETIVPFNKEIPIGLKTEVKTGKAVILSNVSGELKEYDIERQRVYNMPTSESKSMLIRITDQELIDVTGGIVQGMSGSPIIQNGKLVGAITHVLINSPIKGYGITIESMIKGEM